MLMTLEEFSDKMDWEGGALDALDYGLTPEDAPEGEFRDLWTVLYAAHEAMKPHIEAVYDYLDKHLEM